MGVEDGNTWARGCDREVGGLIDLGFLWLVMWERRLMTSVSCMLALLLLLVGVWSYLLEHACFVIC